MFLLISDQSLKSIILQLIVTTNLIQLPHFLINVFKSKSYHPEIHMFILIFATLEFFFTLSFQTFIYPNLVLATILSIPNFILRLHQVINFAFIL